MRIIELTLRRFALICVDNLDQVAGFRDRPWVGMQAAGHARVDAAPALILVKMLPRRRAIVKFKLETGEVNDEVRGNSEGRRRDGKSDGGAGEV
jgi:hypothetical protein